MTLFEEKNPARRSAEGFPVLKQATAAEALDGLVAVIVSVGVRSVVVTSVLTGPVMTEDKVAAKFNRDGGQSIILVRELSL